MTSTRDLEENEKTPAARYDNQFELHTSLHSVIGQRRLSAALFNIVNLTNTSCVACGRKVSKIKLYIAP